MNILTCPRCGSQYEQHPLTLAAQELCPACRNEVSWDEIKTVLAAAGKGAEPGLRLPSTPERPAVATQLTVRERFSRRVRPSLNPFAPRTVAIAAVSQAAAAFGGTGSYTVFEKGAKPRAGVSFFSRPAAVEKTELSSADPFMAIPVQQFGPAPELGTHLPELDVLSAMQSISLELQPKLRAVLAVEKGPAAIPECGG